jgi:hypothetical protein
MLFCRWTSSVKEYLFHFAGVVKEELDGRNSPWRIHEIPRVIISGRRARRVTASVFLKRKLRRERPVDPRQ